MGGIVARECGVRNAECGISGGASIRGSTFHLHSAFRTPHSALLMSVQAIAWSPSGAVRIIDQRALPEARIERDLESAEAVADAIRTLQVRGAPLIGIAAAMGLVAATRGQRGASREAFLARLAQLAPLLANTRPTAGDRKSTRLNSSHGYISYAVFCLKKKKKSHSDVKEYDINTKVY